MKIHIIGGSGTGKSYISEKISHQFGISHFDLDDIFWDNTAEFYGTKMPIDQRAAKLNVILANDDWIIEGVFYDWLNDSFASADYIFVLITSPFVFSSRIIKRFLKRKLGIEKGKRETLKSLKNLLVWTNNYQKLKIPKIVKFLEPYKEKTILLDNSVKIFNYIGHPKH